MALALLQQDRDRSPHLVDQNHLPGAIAHPQGVHQDLPEVTALLQEVRRVAALVAAEVPEADPAAEVAVADSTVCSFNSIILS